MKILTRLSKTLTRIALNLITLAGLAWMIWYSLQLFTHQVPNPLQGSLILLGGFVGWVLFIKLAVSRYCRTFPSFKFTVFALLCLAIVFSFAGVAPMSDYKDTLVVKWDTWTQEQDAKRAEERRLVQEEAEKQKKEQSVAITPTPVPVIPKAVEPPATIPIGISEVEKEAFDLINQARMEAGLKPTTWDDKLYKLSKAHTEDMADKGMLFHTPMGAGYGENAWGASWGRTSKSSLARTMVNGWLSSPLHKAWIMHIPLKTSVVSIVDDSRGQYASWTFYMAGDGGPPLINKAYNMWQTETGGSIPWLDWLDVKGYPSNTEWLVGK